MKQVIIAEKAKAARALRDGLRDNFESHITDNGLCGYYESSKYIITFAKGHLLKLYGIDDYIGEKTPWSLDVLPYTPKEFKYKPISDSTSAKQLKIIKSLINRKDVDEIVHYGDPDREGELLIRLILNYCGNKKPVKRMWCLAILPEAAKDAFINRIDDSKYDSWYEEGLTRQHLDWLWGINFSRFISLKSGQLMPVGRVIVPIVKFIYDRDEKIKNFQKQNFWAVEGVFKKDNKSFTLRNKDLIYEFEDKNDASKKSDELNKGKTSVVDIKTKTIKKKPNKLFSLLKLQSYLNKKHGMKMEESMKHIQNLYLNGFITYPRTPTEYIGDSEINNTKKIVQTLISNGLNLKFHTRKSVFDNEKCVGHTAIIITNKFPKDNELNNSEKMIYDVIYNRFVSNFAADDCEILETTVNIKNGDTSFELVGEKIITSGFLSFESNPIKSTLPEFKIGEILKTIYSVVEKESSPPKKVSVAELNSFLKAPYKDKIKNLKSDDELYKMLSEGCTIGTEATTTVIINNAIKYGYISSNKTTYSIEDKGIQLIAILDKLNIDLYRDKNIEFNKELKEILNNTKTRNEVVSRNIEDIQSIINLGNKTYIDRANASNNLEIIGICPKCGKKVYENAKSYCCEGYKDEPKCNFSLWKDNKLLKSQGKKLTKTMVKKLISGKPCEVKGLTSSKTGKKYNAKLILDLSGDYANIKFDF